MMRFLLRTPLLAVVVFLLLTPSPASAELYINEIFFDPGGAGLDTRDEYIELRGTPGMSLENHFLVLVENEGRLAQERSTGEIENLFALGDDPATPAIESPYTLGSNGYLTIRQAGNVYFLTGSPAPGTTDLTNFGGGPGWGSGSTSTVRHRDQGNDGKTENSGFTAMLIRNDGAVAPSLGLDLDAGADGLDGLDTSGPQWRIDNPNTGVNWTIVDSIGVFSEAGEAGTGRVYAPVNFGPEIPGQELAPSKGGVPDGMGGFIFEPAIEIGATYVGLDYEIEYLGRWGNSTGQTPHDWHASNLTDRPGSGSDGVPDFRQSCIDPAPGSTCHAMDDGDPSTPATSRPVESNQAVPYGTKLVHTLGRTNYMTGDFNSDGLVDAADYTVWRDTRDTIGSEDDDLAADPNHDFVVDRADYDLWAAHYGAVTGSSSGAFYIRTPVSTAAPEPSSFGLLALASLICPFPSRRR